MSRPGGFFSKESTQWLIPVRRPEDSDVSAAETLRRRRQFCVANPLQEYLAHKKMPTPLGAP